MPEELKSCPFCNEQPKIITCPFYYYIHCYGCGVSGPGEHTKQKVIEHWNTRGYEMSKELKPPKWYSTNEVYEWLKRQAPVRISNKLSKRDAEWLADEFQKAFNKGFDMALSQCIKAWNTREG